MSELIKALRAAGSFTVTKGYYSKRSEEEEKNAELLEDLDWAGKKVHSEFKEGGRWSNYETKVYKVEEDGEIVYFEVYSEVPATEMQDGGDFETTVTEVEPYEVTITKYRAK